MERETGFESATLNLGSGFTDGPGVPSGSQAVGTAESTRGADVQRSQPKQLLPGDFATPLLRDVQASAVDAEPMLTVREVARGLAVSTATVYKLCASGKLRHVRLLNVIRVPASAVAANP